MTLPRSQGLTIINGGQGIRFQIPANPAFTAFSAPIEYRFQTEDTPVAGGLFPFGNAWLDPGEDSNNDGILNRNIVRVQGGQKGWASERRIPIADATFSCWKTATF